MAETYLITAKTVAEAIAVAKREYEDADHEISYEIVRMEKKGLFGLIGAKDAQIKVTVSKIVSVQSELGSLVADIKNLKTVTDRGSSGSPAVSQNQGQSANEKPQKQNAQKTEQQGQQQKQNNQPKQNGQQKQQNNQPKQNQNPQNSQKQQGQQKQQQNPPKQSQQNQNPPKEPKEQKQQNQPKADKQQNQNPQRQQNQPKAERQQNQQKQQNPPKAEKPVEKTVEKPAEKPAELPVERVEAPVVKNDEAAETRTEHRSALGNQAAPRKRSRQKKAVQHTVEEDLSAAVTVSAPVGLTDFVGGTNEGGFGSASTASSGRMSNDIRKKNRNQKPAVTLETPAEVKEIAPAPQSAEQTQTSASSSSRRSRNRRGSRGPVQRTDSDAFAARYDIAESDEDYEKLDALVAEAEDVFEAKRAEAEPVRPAQEERRREAITEAEMNYALDFVNTLLRNMQLDARAVRAECPEGEEFDVTEEATVYPKIDIVGDDTGILIGHHGETLDSIQYLANLSALRRTKSRDGDYVKIVVDIENYRQKREDTLRTLARRMAARAVKYRRNIFLEPMNAYERRIIHSELQSYEGVSTHSVGTDRDRKIIVTYEGPDKQPDRRRGEEKAADQPSQQQKKSRSRRGRGGDRSVSENAAQANVNTEEASASSEPKERRRPRKPTKMSIEELTDWLPDAGEAVETDDANDTLNVMSGLRERAAEEARAEDTADAADELAETLTEVVGGGAARAEEAVREAEANFEAKAAALLETLGAMTDEDSDSKE